MRNFMIFLFTRQQRLSLAYAFVACNILQVVAGCVLTAGALYVCLSVTKHLYAEKAEIQFVFTVFALFGTHIIIQYLIGIKMVEMCFLKAHKRSTKRNLYLWLLSCCNTILDMIILATMIVRISKHIVRSIRHSMEKGMRHYLTDPIWKHTMDRWQYSLQCCGVNGYRDWYAISWLDKYHVNVDSPNVHNLLLSKDHLHLPVVPWSCCRLDNPLQCFHDPLQQTESAHIWREEPELLEMSLYATGCLETIRSPTEWAFVVFLILCILFTIVQLIIIIIARFLYTSCRSAVILRDTMGKAPGWLFSRDCMAERRGRTLSEIKMDLEHESETEGEEDEYNSDGKSSPVARARASGQATHRGMYEPQHVMRVEMPRKSMLRTPQTIISGAQPDISQQLIQTLERQKPAPTKQKFTADGYPIACGPQCRYAVSHKCKSCPICNSVVYNNKCQCKVCKSGRRYQRSQDPYEWSPSVEDTAYSESANSARDPVSSATEDALMLQ